MSAALQILLPSLVGLFLLAGGVWIVWRRRRNPEEKERRRRLMLHRTGRLMEAMVADYQDSLVWYSYTVNGVSYHAAQDLRGVSSLPPDDAPGVIGPAYIKYSPRNPANSIVACEEWSGFWRTRNAAGAGRPHHPEKEKCNDEKIA